MIWLPCCSAGKEFAHSVGDTGREDPLETGMATHSSILVWRIPWTEEPCRQSMGSQRVSHTETISTQTYHPMLLPGLKELRLLHILTLSELGIFAHLWEYLTNITCSFHLWYIFLIYAHPQYMSKKLLNMGTGRENYS